MQRKQHQPEKEAGSKAEANGVARLQVPVAVVEPLPVVAASHRVIFAQSITLGAWLTTISPASTP